MSVLIKNVRFYIFLALAIFNTKLTIAALNVIIEIGCNFLLLYNN